LIGLKYDVPSRFLYGLSDPDSSGRQQERQMRKFTSQGQAQRFLSCHGMVNNLFRLGRHLMSAKNYRFFRERAFIEWSQASSIQH
jgi:putative transposase